MLAGLTLFVLQSEGVYETIVGGYKDAAVGKCDAAEMGKRGDCVAAGKQFFAVLGVEGIEHGVSRAAETFSRVHAVSGGIGLMNIFAAGKREDHAIGDDRRLRHAEVARDPSGRERRRTVLQLEAKR